MKKVIKKENDKQKIKRLEKILRQTSKFMKTRDEWNEINPWCWDFHSAVEKIDKNLK